MLTRRKFLRGGAVVPVGVATMGLNPLPAPEKMYVAKNHAGMGQFGRSVVDTPSHRAAQRGYNRYLSSIIASVGKV